MEATTGFRPLPSHYDHCFGCGVEHPTGLHLRMTGDDEALRVEGAFTVTEHHEGAPRLAHGGVVAAAVDEGMGYLVWLLGTAAVTAHLEVDYRRPVPVGSTLRLEGRVERVDGRKIFTAMTGTIEGTVAVEARAMFLKVGVEHFVRHMRPAAEPVEPAAGEHPPYNP